MMHGSPTFARLAAWSVLLFGLSMGCGQGCGEPNVNPPAAREMPDADRSTVGVSRTQGVRANGEDAVDIQVTVVKADGTPLPGRTVRVSVSGEGNTVAQPTGTTDEQGQASARLVSTVAGLKRVTVSVEAEGGPVTLSSRPTVEFILQPAARLAFTAAPSSGTAGAALGVFEVAIQNADGETLRDATGSVTVALGSGPSEATLKGTVTVAAVEGVARFEGLVLEKAARGYTLVASAGGLSDATSGVFDVVSAAPASLVLSHSGLPVTAGMPESVEVFVRDVFGNDAAGYTGTVRFSSDEGSATLPGDYTFTAADQGRHVFTDGVTMRLAGARRLTVTDLAEAAFTSSLELAVVPGAVKTLVFAEPLANRSVRSSFDVRVVLTDEFGNRVQAGTPAVTLSANKVGRVTGLGIVTPVDGVAFFPGLSIAEEDTGYVLTASAPGLGAVPSNAFDVIDDVPPARPVLSQTANTSSSITVFWERVGDDGMLGTPSSYELRYATSDIVSEADFASALPVTPPVPAPTPSDTSWSVTIPGLTSNTSYYVALKVTDNSGNAVRSASLPASTRHVSATRVVFVEQPRNGTAGAALAPITVEVQDAGGLRVGDASLAVTLTVQGTTGFGPFTVTSDKGLATFTGVRIDKAGTGYTLKATSPSLTPDDSQAFDIAHAGTPRLELTGLGSTVSAGAGNSVTVTVRDAFDNAIEDYTGTVSFSSSDPSASTPAPYTFLAADKGQRTFGNVVLRTSGTRTLTVSAPGLSDATLSTEVVHADPSTLVLSGLPAEARAGTAFDVGVTLKDAYGNVATGYTGTVGFTSSDPKLVPPASGAFTGADAGSKVFSVTLKTAGEQSLTVIDLANSSLSATVPVLRVEPGPARKLAFRDQAAGGRVRAKLAPVTVAVTDEFDNPLDVDAPDITLDLTGGNPEAVLGGGTPAVKPVNGVATFSELTVDQQGTDFRLDAMGGTLDGASSAPFTIVDDIAPGAVSLTLTNKTSIEVGLRWTAVGDDGLAGLASSYELLYATSPVESAPPGSISSVAMDPPQAPGTEELAIVTELSPSTHYYFVLKVRDDAGNTTVASLDTTTNADPCDGYTCTAADPSCAPDGVSRVTYTATCVDVDNTPTCEESQTVTACPGTRAVCFQGACDTASPPGANQLGISEVMHSPSSSSITEYIELTNNTGDLLDLNGLTVLYRNSARITSSFIVGAGSSVPLVVDREGTFVLARNKDAASNGGVSANYQYGDDFTLEGSGQLVLSQAGTTVQDFEYTPSFPQTLGRAMNLSSLVVGTKASAHPWYWCDSETEIQAGGDLGTPNARNTTCGIPESPALAWCNIQYPKTFPSGDGSYPATVAPGSSWDIYGQFYASGVTNRNTKGNDYYPHVSAELGYGTDATNPAGWTWTAASPNGGYSSASSDDDEMLGSLSIPSAGTYRYGFRYRLWNPATSSYTSYVYCDQNGVATPPAGDYGTVTVASPPTEPMADHVVISEFAPAGPGGANDEFIELYNPTGAEVDLSGWKLQYKSATGSAYNTGAFTFPAGAKIAARGYFLVTSSSYVGSVTGDASSSSFQALSGSAGHVRLGRPGIGTGKTEALAVDTVGYGSTSDSAETGPITGALATSGSFERKASSTSTAASMEGGADANRGNGTDSDNNANDFVVRTVRQPQNSASPTESP